MTHDNVPEVQAGLLQGRLDVPHRLPHLILERTGVLTVGKVVPLARNVQRIAGQNSRTEGEACGRLADSLLFGKIAVSDDGDLEARFAGYLGNSQCGSRRRIAWEKFGVVLVEFAEGVVVFEIHEGFHHVPHVETGQLERIAYFIEAILYFARDVCVGAIVSLTRNI